MGTDSNAGNTSGQGKSGKAKFIILGILIAIIIAAMAGTIVYLLLSRNGDNNDNSPVAAGNPEQREVLVTSDNVEAVVEEMEQQDFVPPGYYTVTQNYEWHFPTGDSESTDAHVENLPENTNDVYFDLFLADNEEDPIYQSPVIPREAALEHFKLDTKLDDGTYDCIMVYHLVNEKQETVSTLSMTVKVIIGEE